MTAEPAAAGPACDPCPGCGGDVLPGDTFCEACGRRIASPGVAAPPETDGGAVENIPRLELALDGVAAVSDRGRRRTRNEDAVGLSYLPGPPGVSIAVVCDGVGSTTDAHLAARAAADAAVTTLEAALAAGDPGPERVAAACGDAFAAARDAVAAIPVDWADPATLTPSTTLVAGVVVPGRVDIASMGDGRAYWLPDSGGGRLLTVDDSLAQERIAEGVDPDDALAHPDAHTITRWIGADTTSADPRVASLRLTVPGRLVVCTDGLWNYFGAADALADLVADAPDPSPLTVARTLVSAALGRGGGDNVTVAVADAGPALLPGPTDEEGAP